MCGAYSGQVQVSNHLKLWSLNGVLFSCASFMDGMSYVLFGVVSFVFVLLGER